MLVLKPSTQPTLDPWGTVADLGAEILGGACEIAGAMVLGAPTDALSCGWFSCTQGQFRMTYPFTEHAIMIDGRVTLHIPATGLTETYGPGEAWLIEKGTEVIWTVETPRFIKNYFAVV